MRRGLLRRRVVCVLVLAGCPSDEPPGADTEGEGSTGATAASSTTMSSTGSSSSSATTSEPSTGETTSTTSEDSSSESTAGPSLPGVCLGVDVVGILGEVSSLEGAPVDPECDSVPTPCGGDVIGVWEVESTCGWEVTPNPFSDCEGATMTFTSGEITGTRTFNADMTFAFDTITVFEFDLNLDAMTCYSMDCGGFQLTAERLGFMATCADAGNGTCDCAMSVTQPNTNKGTWSTANNTLVASTLEGDVIIEYCVTGDRLGLWTGITETTSYEQDCASEADCSDALGSLSEFYVCILP